MDTNVIKATKGYARVNDKLVAVKLTKQELFCNDADEWHLLYCTDPTGNALQVKPTDFFETLEDYKHGKSPSTQWELLANGIRVGNTYYAPVNGHVEEIEVKEFLATFEPTEKGWKCVDFRHADGSPYPDTGFYAEADIAEAMTSIDVINEDGTTTTLKGKAKQFELTDAQRKAVNAMMKAVEKAKALGVTFIFDTENEGLFTINGNASEWHIDYEETDKHPVNTRILEIDDFELHGLIDVVSGYDSNIYTK